MSPRAELLPARPRALGPEERMLGPAAPVTLAAADLTVANQFTPTADGTVTHIRFWHAVGHPPGDEHQLALWDANTATAIGFATSPGDVAGYAAGYVEVALMAGPVAVVAGHPYRASYSPHSNLGVSDPIPASLAPHLTLEGGFYSVGQGDYPNVPVSPSHYHVDVVYRETTTGTEPPPTTGKSRALVDRARILTALEVAGIRAPTTGKLSAPAVLVEPGDPWSEPRRMPGRITRWQLTALAGRADSEGALEALGELVDTIDAALRTVPGCELPTWSKPADYTVTGVPYAGAIATVEIGTA